MASEITTAREAPDHPDGCQAVAIGIAKRAANFHNDACRQQSERDERGEHIARVQCCSKKGVECQPEDKDGPKPPVFTPARDEGECECRDGSDDRSGRQVGQRPAAHLGQVFGPLP